MGVTIVEDCVGYRDESCHLETMRQMADHMGASGITYQELMDDLDDFEMRYKAAFQHGVRSQRKVDSKEKTSAWLSSLE
jgi:hypothetical protein